MKIENNWFTIKKELVFQVILNILLFVSYAIDPPILSIHLHHFFYYVNYLSAALIISYILLPKFFFKQDYVRFFLYSTLVITLIMFVEEFVLEQLFFQQEKGNRFGNIFINLIDVLPIVVILCGFKFAWEAAKKQNEIIKLKSLIKDSELQFLKTQINPHFLFNNLNNLYSYAVENSSRTPEIILELASVLRYILYDCKENFVPLEKEINHVINFTKLNELQIENRGSVSIKTKNINGDFIIAPLILNVFIENAFKHCTASQSDKIIINILIELKGNMLFFKCDNSFGSVSNHDNLPHGIGLENVKKRLEFLYKNAYDLEFSKKNQMYSVALQLQLKKS